MKNSLRACAVLTLSCLASWGCGLSLGPQVKTQYVIVEPGRPVEILQSAKVSARQLGDDGAAVQQDVGGWVAMPKEHFEALKRAIEKTSGQPAEGGK